MPFDFVLSSSCSQCGSTTNLYGSNCKHMTLCSDCGKTMAENHAACSVCGVTLTRLIREYNIRLNPSDGKSFFVGRFPTGAPKFPKKRSAGAENRWSAQKEGLQGRRVARGANKAWLLTDETGRPQYRGHLEGSGSQSSIYYVLTTMAKDLVAVPAGCWYKFSKELQYRQLSLEEAEEKMSKRKKAEDGYGRWMMKAANIGAAAFGTVETTENKPSGSRKRRKKAGGGYDDDEEGNDDAWDRGGEEGGGGEAEELKKELGIDATGGQEDDEGLSDLDMDNDDADDIERGDHWDHDDGGFTDDDEDAGFKDSGGEEESDHEGFTFDPLAGSEDDDASDEEGNTEVKEVLSEAGKQMKMLLEKASADDFFTAWVPAPNEEEDSIEKPVAVGSSSKTSNRKQKLNRDGAASSSNAPSIKEPKTEHPSP